MKPVCFLHDLVCGALDSPDIRQVTFNELDSALIFAQRDALPIGPIVFRGYELLLAPGNDEYLVYPMYKELRSDLCISSVAVIRT